MLEKVPPIIGHALRGLRSGFDKTVYYDFAFDSAPESITLSSPAFDDEGELPAIYTEDGKKISPPLAWANVPAEAQSLILVIEDPDAPKPSPIIHAIVFNMPASDGYLEESALPAPGGGGKSTLRLAHNTLGKSQYLPPDPPPGHGVHRYLFELYALNKAFNLPEDVSRKALVEALEGHVIAKGLLIGTYERK